MSTSTACEQFFDIPELPQLLMVFLDRKDVSRLARTCRKMYTRCTPPLFRNLLARDTTPVKLLLSTPAVLALARNSQHVRTLSLELHELVYYYNCLLAFQDINSHLSDAPPIGPLASEDSCIYGQGTLPKVLTSTIIKDECNLPTQSGLRCYYYRSAPITLIDEETQHFARLKNLCRRIGALTELQTLELWMVIVDTIYNAVDDYYFLKPRSFSAMLNLQDPGTGRPGFLHHFSGVKKLKTIREVDQRARNGD
ncbi:hypothetical protein BGZ47_010239 [Haplosporangium gracile]|nr:hypothetical protein BGZ47_010239 [Haplosporangium gracile]